MQRNDGPAPDEIRPINVELNVARRAIVDLNYEEDKLVAVDFNLVATEDNNFVEIQSSGEEAAFTCSQLDQMLALARNGISALIGAQRAVLARIMVTPAES